MLSNRVCQINSNHNTELYYFLDGMKTLDGMIMTGGSDFYYKRNILHSTTWFHALIHWAVNYTTDHKEWKQYKNKDGEVHVRIRQIAKRKFLCKKSLYSLTFR